MLDFKDDHYNEEPRTREGGAPDYKEETFSNVFKKWFDKHFLMETFKSMGEGEGFFWLPL